MNTETRNQKIRDWEERRKIAQALRQVDFSVEKQLTDSADRIALKLNKLAEQRGRFSLQK